MQVNEAAIRKISFFRNSDISFVCAVLPKLRPLFQSPGSILYVQVPMFYLLVGLYMSPLCSDQCALLRVCLCVCVCRGSTAQKCTS